MWSQSPKIEENKEKRFQMNSGLKFLKFPEKKILKHWFGDVSWLAFIENNFAMWSKSLKKIRMSFEL